MGWFRNYLAAAVPLGAFQISSSTLQKSDAVTEAKFKSVPKPDLGYAGTAKIIAIGPQGGKITGYNHHGEPVYAGTPKANALAAVKLTKDAPSLSDSAVNAWLTHLGFPHKDGDPFVTMPPASGEKLAAAFGVKPAAKGATYWGFFKKDLYAHAGQALVPPAAEAVEACAALAAGEFGPAALITPAKVATLKEVPTSEYMGSHGAIKVQDNNGKLYIFKPSKDAWVSRAEEAFYRIARLTFPEPDLYPRAQIVKHGGVEGVLIEWLPGEKLGTESKGHGVPADAIKQHFNRLVQHHVLDWLLSNHDAHGANFVVNGGDVHAVDKGQAWKHVTSDLGMTDKGPGNGSSPVYQQLWGEFENGPLKGADPVKAVEAVLQGVGKMSLEQFHQIALPYLQALAVGKPNINVKYTWGAMKARFQNIAADWEGFLSEKMGTPVKLDLGGVPPTAEVSKVPEPPAAVAAVASVPEPQKSIQLPGWPLTKGPVKVHHPGEPPPAGVKWPGKYPGPGYNAEVTYKGKPYAVSFLNLAGKFSAVLKLPNGLVVPCDSPQNVADKILLNEKGLPLDTTSTKMKELKIGYSASKLFKLDEFAAVFQASSTTAPPTVADKTAQELVASGAVPETKKTLTLHEQAQLVPDGIITDPALMPVALQTSVADVLAEAEHVPWPSSAELPPGTVWKTSDEDGTSYVSLEAGQPLLWMSTTGGHTSTAIPLPPDSPLLEKVAADPQVQKLQQEWKAAHAPKAITGNNKPPIQVPDVSVGELAGWMEGLPVGTKIHHHFSSTIVAEKLPYKGSESFWKLGDGDVPATLSDVANAWASSEPEGALKVPEKPPLAIPTLDGPKPEIEFPKSATVNDPTASTHPLMAGTTVTVQKKGLGAVTLHAHADGTFGVSGTLFTGPNSFKSLAAASDYVWLVQQGYKDAAEYKAKNNVNKIPSGAGWKFWGLKAALTPSGAVQVGTAPLTVSAPSSAKTLSAGALMNLTPGAIISSLEGDQPEKFQKQFDGSWKSKDSGLVTSSTNLTAFGQVNTLVEAGVTPPALKPNPPSTKATTAAKAKVVSEIPEVPTTPAVPSIAGPQPPLAVQTLEELPKPLQAPVKALWGAVQAGLHTVTPGGDSLAAKSPYWDAWVPPPGMLIEGKHPVTGKKLYLVTTVSGYVHNDAKTQFDPASAVSFAVMDEAGKISEGLDYMTGGSALASALDAYDPKLLDMVGDPKELMGFFNLQGAAFPGGSTMLSPAPPPLASVVVAGKVPADAEQTVVATTADAASLVELETTAAKYGVKSFKISGIGEKSKGKWPDHSYINAYPAKGKSGEDAAQALQQLVNDLGLQAHVEQAPKASWNGSAYVVLKNAAFETSAPTVTATATAASLPSPSSMLHNNAAWWDNMVANEPAILAAALKGTQDKSKLLASVPIGTQLHETSFTQDLFVKTQAGWLPVVNGKIMPSPIYSNAELGSLSLAMPAAPTAAAPATEVLSLEQMQQLPVGAKASSATGLFYKKIDDDHWEDQYGKVHPDWSLQGLKGVPSGAEHIAVGDLLKFPAGTTISGDSGTFTKLPTGSWADSAGVALHPLELSGKPYEVKEPDPAAQNPEPKTFSAGQASAAYKELATSGIGSTVYLQTGDTEHTYIKTATHEWVGTSEDVQGNTFGSQSLAEDTLHNSNLPNLKMVVVPAGMKAPAKPVKPEHVLIEDYATGELVTKLAKLPPGAVLTSGGGSAAYIKTPSGKWVSVNSSGKLDEIPPVSDDHVAAVVSAVWSSADITPLHTAKTLEHATEEALNALAPGAKLTTSNGIASWLKQPDGQWIPTASLAHAGVGLNSKSSSEFAKKLKFIQPAGAFTVTTPPEFTGEVPAPTAPPLAKKASQLLDPFNTTAMEKKEILSDQPIGMVLEDPDGKFWKKFSDDAWANPYTGGVTSTGGLALKAHSGAWSTPAKGQPPAPEVQNVTGYQELNDSTQEQLNALPVGAVLKHFKKKVVQFQKLADGTWKGSSGSSNTAYDISGGDYLVDLSEAAQAGAPPTSYGWIGFQTPSLNALEALPVGTKLNSGPGAPGTGSGYTYTKTAEGWAGPSGKTYPVSSFLTGGKYAVLVGEPASVPAFDFTGGSKFAVSVDAPESVSTPGWVGAKTPTKAALDALPVGTTLVSSHNDNEYVKTAKGKWQAKAHTGGAHSSADFVAMVSPPSAPAKFSIVGSFDFDFKAHKTLKKKDGSYGNEKIVALMPAGTTLFNGIVTYEKLGPNFWKSHATGTEGTDFWVATKVKQGTGSTKVIPPSGSLAAPAPKKPPKPKPPPAPPAELSPEAKEKIAKTKEYAAWLKVNPKAAGTPALSVFQNKAAGGMKLYAHAAPDGDLLLGAPDFDALKKAADNWAGFPPHAEVQTPLGTCLKVSVPAFQKAMPGAGTVAGPDGKEYPEGTKFQTKEVTTSKADVLKQTAPLYSVGPYKTDKLSVVEEGGKWHIKKGDKVVSTFQTQDAADQAKKDMAANTSVLQFSGIDDETQKKIASAMEQLGVKANGPLLKGGSYTLAFVPSAVLKEPGKTEQVTEVTKPPAPPPFIAAAPPFVLGQQAQGEIAARNHGDLDALAAIKHSEWGHAIRIGKPGTLRDFMLKTKRVTEAGKEFFVVTGELLDFQPHLAPAMKQGTVDMPATSNLNQFLDGVHDADKTGDSASFGGYLGVTDSGTEVSVVHGNHWAHQNQFFAKIPVGSDVRAELSKAFDLAGQDGASAVAEHDDEAERVFIKSQVVRAGLGAKGYWDKEALNGSLNRKKYADEKWLDAQLATLKLTNAAATAKIVVGGGNVHHVVMDDVTDDALDHANIKYLSQGHGHSSVEVVAHFYAQGQGIPCRKQGYWNGTNSSGASASSDDKKGGAQGNMTRIMAVDSGGASTGYAGTGNGDYRTIYKRDILKRADYHFHDSDQFGSIKESLVDYSDLGSGKNNRALIYKSLQSDNECLFEHGIALSDIAGVSCVDASAQSELINAFKKKAPGQDAINGLPLTDFFFVGGSYHAASTIMAKCKGLK